MTTSCLVTVDKDNQLRCNSWSYCKKKIHTNEWQQKISKITKNTDKKDLIMNEFLPKL